MIEPTLEIVATTEIPLRRGRLILSWGDTRAATDSGFIFDAVERHNACVMWLHQQYGFQIMVPTPQVLLLSIVFLGAN